MQQQNQIRDFAEMALKRFTEDITDHFFLYIEKNNTLKQAYRRILKTDDVDTTNTQLGKAVKEWFRLENRKYCSLR
jgi:hypothetical protein